MKSNALRVLTRIKLISYSYPDCMSGRRYTKPLWKDIPSRQALRTLDLQMRERGHVDFVQEWDVVTPLPYVHKVLSPPRLPCISYIALQLVSINSIHYGSIGECKLGRLYKTLSDDLYKFFRLTHYSARSNFIIPLAVPRGFTCCSI